MEATGAVTRLIPGPVAVLRVVCESLAGRPQLLVEEKPWGARRPRGRTAPGEEQSLEGSNPMSGSGMEQAREAMRGAKRREGEKPWGRNATAGMGPRGVMWLLVAEIRWRGQNLGRGVTARSRWGSRSVSRWRTGETLKGSQSLREDPTRFYDRVEGGGVETPGSSPCTRASARG